jgi:hypothetical protein
MEQVAVMQVCHFDLLVSTVCVAHRCALLTFNCFLQNIFYNKKITKIFDLKGSLRGRFAAQIQQSAKDDGHLETPTHGSEAAHAQKKRDSEQGSADGEGDSDIGSEKDESNAGYGSKGQASSTLLDGDFLEFTAGRPMPMNDRAKAVFHMSILNVSSTNQFYIYVVFVLT